MEERRLTNQILKGIAILIGLTFILTGFTQVSAAVGWSDNFDDGNMNGWTIDTTTERTGDFHIVDNALFSVYEMDYWGWVDHPSTVTEGTWSFDFYHNGSTIHSNVIVMGNGSLGDVDGYGVHFSLYGSDPPTIYLTKFWGKIGAGMSSLQMYVHDSQINGLWVHFDLTRNATTGEMHLFMDDEHIAEATDLTYDYSEVLAFSTGKYYLEGQGGVGIDNIVVDDNITVTPPDPTTTDTTTTTDPTTTDPTTTDPVSPTPIDPMLLAMVGGGVVVVVLGAVVCMKRK